jgi:hypothetical protein
MKTASASAAPFWHLPVPGDCALAHALIEAVWWLVWPKLFGPGPGARAHPAPPQAHTEFNSEKCDLGCGMSRFEPTSGVLKTIGSLLDQTGPRYFDLLFEVILNPRKVLIEAPASVAAH